MVNCIPNEGARLSEQHRGLVKMPCGDTPDDRGVSTGTANTRTIITASWPPSLHLAHPADPCAPGSFHSHSSAASPSYVCKQPHASLTLSGLPFNGVGRASPAPVQWIEDVRVPLPIQWIRCTSPASCPMDRRRASPASCPMDKDTQVLLPVQWIRMHEPRPVSWINGSGRTSPVPFPVHGIGAHGSCFLFSDQERPSPASCSMD